MAKTKPGLFPKISGSTGGTQFRNTRYGTVLAQTSYPINRITDARQFTKSKFANASRLWAKVNPRQVAEWIKLADTFIITDKLGNTYPMRGIDLFKKVTRNLIEINEPLIFDAPKKIYPKELISPEFEIIATDKKHDIRLYFKNKIRKDTKIIIYATPNLKYGVNSPKPSKYRKISVLDHTFHSGSSLLNDYRAVFKVNNNDTNRIAFRIRPVSKISGLPGIEYSVLQIPD